MQRLFSWFPLALGFFVLVLSLGVVLFSVRAPVKQDIRSQAAEVVGSMSLSPSSGDYLFSSGQTYPVGIVVDSSGASIDGVDVIINFDPKKVQIGGNSLSTTTLFERLLVNQVDNVSGKIRFSALSFNPKPVTGIVATFLMRPLTKGTVSLDFDFTSGSTTDSNLAQHGTAKDILGKVTNGSFTFK